MKRIFRPTDRVVVPDGTAVYPFLNPTDSGSDLPVGLFDGVSVALGEIAARQASKIHAHPLITMLVWVIGGRLDVTMKDADAEAPYTLALAAEDGAVALPGTFLQLSNPAAEPCRVLYVASPPYVSVRAADGTMVYDDAVVVDQDWAALAQQRWQPAALAEPERLRAARKRAVDELARRKAAGTALG